MSSELGRGDVVCAIRDESAGGGCPLAIKSGDRVVVLEVRALPNPGCLPCGICHDLPERGLALDLPFDPDESWGLWCPCNWRKIGGSRADTVRRFAEDLQVSKPLDTPVPAKTPENA